MDKYMELIWAFMINHEKGWGVLSHTHDYFQMYYCLSGCGTVLLEHQSISLEKNGCVLIWPEQIHEVAPVKSGHFRIIDTTFYVHDKKMESTIYQAPQYIPVTDPRFRDVQKDMQREWNTDSLFSKEMAELLFTQSILLLLRDAAHLLPFSSIGGLAGEGPLSCAYRSLGDFTKNMSGTEKIITDYLNAHFLEKLTLDKISQDLHYSKNYICKTFTNTTGYTIKQYINYLRINKSYELVCYTDSRFSEIAAQCGFSSIHYFSRTFHRIIGITPTQARARSISADLHLYGPRRYRYLNKDSSKKQDI